jgi:ribosomal protein S18 acetylase RimI-like enzyme
MARLHREAEREGKCRVTLSSFTNNQRAIRFYQRLGYKVIEGDQAFVSLSRSLVRK